MLTDVSGRGLGLAIVREKVEKLGGTIAVDDAGDQQSGGTRFRIMLPSTLATFRGLLVEVDGQRFVLPSLNVERVARVPCESIRTVENRETIELDGMAMSLVSLGETLGLHGGVQSVAGHADARYRQVAIVVASGKRIAFSVDAIVADQEVLVKKIGPQLLRVPNIAGVTVLDRGRLVPILNVQDLWKSALKVRHAERAAVVEELPQSILVVEDSITSRSLIKGILESAGYRVSVAVDGMDGLAALRSGQFDLVVSDVEMPRMDGFDLTAKLRSEIRFAGLPVILVTALDSREHKERGIEVGANAYIVKSSFDQSNLLDAVRRLI
jgi:two-component system chemotaxis sensor kinase CheA